MKAGEGFCLVVAGIYAPRLVYYELRLVPTTTSSSDEEISIAIVPPTKGDINWRFAYYMDNVGYFFRDEDESPVEQIENLLVSMGKQIDALPEGASTKPIIDALLASVAML